MSEQRGLRNPDTHGTTSDGEPYCESCGVCDEGWRCRCCLAAEVEALRAQVQAVREFCAATNPIRGELHMAALHGWDTAMEMVLQLLESGEIKGFAFRIANPSIIAAVEDWHKAKRDARVRTHSAECWRWHQECAEYRIEKLSAQVQAVRDAIEAELERHTLTNLGDFMFLDQALGRILNALDGDNDA